MQESTLEDIREGTLALQLLGRAFQPKVCKNQSSSDEEQIVNREKTANEFESSRENISRTKRRIASHQGTQITYISMVSEAIRALGGQATCPQIASYMEKHFSSLLANRKVKQWRNSVSGCLSTYCIRHGRDAQGRVVWKLNEDNETQPTRKVSPVHKQEKADLSSHDEEEFDDEAEEEEIEEEEDYQQSEEDEDFVNSRPRKMKRSRSSDSPSTPEKKPIQPQSPKNTTPTPPQSASDTAQNYSLLQQKLENAISEPLKKRLKGSASGSESPQSPRSPISPLIPSPHSPPSPSFQAHPASPSKSMDEKSFQDFLVNKLQEMQDQISKMTGEITSLRSEVQTLKSTKPASASTPGMIPISSFLS